jgi:hypothetical protein
VITGPGTECAVEQDVYTAPQVGHASDGGEFVSPKPPNGGEGVFKIVKILKFGYNPRVKIEVKIIF